MVQRNRVYAWEFPVRLTHWLNVLSILTLSVTGFYIGNPFSHAILTSQYIMGTIRFIHFVAAYVFLFSLIVRLYWAFAGNKYASWKVWFPFSGRRFSDLLDAVKFYAFMSRKPPYAVGHTALAGITYLVIFALMAFMVFSGFAMYQQPKPGGFVWSILGGWLLGIMNLQTIRLYHHLTMYILLAFTLLHVYISWWLDTVEKNGIMGSIFGGYKFVTGKEWE
jgi:Ni/Fe-hydrogenase 1 B-type cytochrome subunit